jgi:hypothetical protein
MGFVRIDNFLEDNKLETIPNYTDNWMDGEITLKHKKKAKNKKENDPIQRIKLLPAANKEPISISRDAQLRAYVEDVRIPQTTKQGAKISRPECYIASTRAGRISPDLPWRLMSAIRDIGVSSIFTSITNPPFPFTVSGNDATG